MTGDDQLEPIEDPSDVAALYQLGAAERLRRLGSARPSFRVPEDMGGVRPVPGGHPERRAWAAGLRRRVGSGWLEVLGELSDALNEVDPRCRIVRAGKDVEGLLEVELSLPRTADPVETARLADGVRSAVKAARRRSATICEITGRPGQALVAAGRPVVLDPLIAPDRFAVFAAPPESPSDPAERIQFLEALLLARTEVAQRLLDEVRWLRSHGSFPEY